MRRPCRSFTAARSVLREKVIDVDDEAHLARRVAIMELWTDAAELILDQVSAALEHLHDDVRAIREALHIPRPACYPPADDGEEARFPEG